MPSATEILAGLTAIANENLSFATGWHVGLAFVLAALAAGWRPSQRLTAALLVLPILSVATLAWLYRNPFNGTVFTLLAVALLALAFRVPRDPVTPAPRWALVAGGLMVACGWLYPHFLDEQPFTTYLYAAPTGLVPCPTLSVVIGFALLGNGLGARAWPAVLAGAGLFYGLFGTLRLGVQLDWGLVLGSAALLAAIFAPRTTSTGWAVRHT